MKIKSIKKLEHEGKKVQKLNDKQLSKVTGGSGREAYGVDK